jgi:trigger factor
VPYVKVSSTELPPRQVSLAIEVEQERLERAMNEAFQRLAGRVDVPGFRRGKAPRSMVERILGRERIVEEALEHLVPDVVNEAIDQEKVEPYTRPRVESIEFDPLRVKAVVGLAPKVELGDYRGELKVPAEEPNVGDKDVDAVIERLRGSYAQWAPVEREVRTGDQVGIDLNIKVEGSESPLVDSKDATYNVDPDGAQPAPGFVEQIVGMQPGESKAFQLSMADDYRDPDVAGKPGEFSVTLHWVKERELPALDDEFAQQVGEYTDVAGLRSAINTQLRQREEERVREKLEDAAMTRLVEISSIEFPPQLIEHQAQHMLDTFTRNVEQQGLQLSQYLRLVGKEEDDFKSEIRVEAEARVRRSLALDAFADAEQIDAEQPQADDEAGYSRERKALARLLELATGNGHESGTEKATESTKTTDTQKQTRKASKAAEVEEDPETA